MTLNKAAWAIDGATSAAALARLGIYAILADAEGIVKKADLKVSALSVPGQGVRIAGGGGVVLNRYQTSPSQSYVIMNNGEHIVPSNLMPPSNPAQQTYIVAIAVGDVEFSQAGHPYMPTTIPSGQESTFEYVRPIVVLESAFNARAYPAVPLARLVIPANTTTIQTSMITDIRALVNPRSKLEMAHVSGPAADNVLNGGGGTPGTYERFPDVSVITVTVPAWAKTAKIIGFVEGVKVTKNGVGKLRAYVQGQALATPVTNLDEVTASTVRRSYNFGGEIDVESVAGTSRSFSVEATPNNTNSKGAYVADAQTSIGMQVYFEEKPV